jgi:glycosyltransferase involved in cell wall biosynthesis
MDQIRDVATEGADDPPSASILRRLDLLEERLEETQALVARTYESLARWPEMLSNIRAQSDYEAAFAGEPLVSVRVATFNSADVLCERALASLLRQDYANWECLVVGDACDDETGSRVRSLGDARIKFVNLPFRGPYPDTAKALWYVAGIPPANYALENATGKWVAPLDHDDEWADNHISLLLSHAQDTHAEVVYGRIRTILTSTGAEGSMGAWPPQRGEFGFLGAIHHSGLTAMRYDMNCRFADEPGDWNLARRMWDAGVRFAFVDEIVATHFHEPKTGPVGHHELVIAELRDWTRQLEEARDWWRARAEAAEAALPSAQGKAPAP